MNCHSQQFSSFRSNLLDQLVHKSGRLAEQRDRETAKLNQYLGLTLTINSAKKVMFIISENSHVYGSGTLAASWSMLKICL